jgi:hypothetical protein
VVSDTFHGARRALPFLSALASWRLGVGGSVITGSGASQWEYGRMTTGLMPPVGVGSRSGGILLAAIMRIWAEKQLPSKIYVLISFCRP